MPTTLVPIDADAAGPSRPPPAPSTFAEQAEDGDDAPDLATLVRRIRGAKRIVVVCGAGVSTAAAIPDFRSARGLFSGSKGHSVKDLFNVKSLTSPALLSEHHALMTELCRLASAAEPTAFHSLLAALDAEGRLLRCYTQNIDGLESRAGLSTGIPAHLPRASPSRKGKGRATPAESCDSAETTPGPPLGEIGDTLNPEPPSYPPAPRCIPLHGLLDTLHCTLCRTKEGIDKYLPLPGEPIACPACNLSSSIRSALSERSRKVGTLRPSVVLYDEDHPEAEMIGTVMERDLRGTGRRGEREGRADLLIVAGTSLSIRGVKRMVKEMAKSLAARSAASVRDGRDVPIRTVYVNAEPPSKPAEWDGVFDVWAQGDVQRLAALVADETFAPPLAAQPKTPRKSTPRKKTGENGLPTPSSSADTPTKRRKRAVSGDETPTKRRRKAPSETPTKKRPSNPSLPLTPRPTPPRPQVSSRSSQLPSPSPQLRFTSPSPSPPPKLALPRGAIARFSPPPPEYEGRAEYVAVNTKRGGM